LQTKIVLVTTGQPALNPRLVKEADALADAGYDVTVIYAYWNTWGYNFTQLMLPEKKWKAVRAGGHPGEKPLVYFFSRLTFKFFRLVFAKFGIFQNAAVARSTPSLIRQAKKYKAHLYIGHNLGALPAVALAAKANNAKYCFDAEDFHRRESTDDLQSTNYLIVKQTEDRYFPGLSYLSASSPEIGSEYQMLYPYLSPTTILNLFPEKLTKISVTEDRRIKLFWFSQTIGINRGLEDVAKALTLLPKEKFELHLLGNITTQEKVSFIDQLFANVNVTVHSPIPPDDIIVFASQFDIGLATEQSTPLNRDICLTNKLFSYLNAGLAIVASTTTAQKSFLNQHPEVGQLYQQDNAGELANILMDYHDNREFLFNTKKAALKLCHESINWEKESEKLLALVKGVLTSN